MSRFHTFQRSWQLFRGSLRILFRNPRLALFPVVTFVCTAAIALFFFAPAVLLPTGHSWGQSAHWLALASRWGFFTGADGHAQHWHPKLVTDLYLVAIYLVSMVSATYFNVAFYNEIIRALAGEPVSIRGGLAFARHRLRSILLWSLFAGVVGLLIRALEQRLGVIGRIVVRLVGMAWSVASVFVIPVIIRDERANPFALLRNSAATLRRTWGKALVGYVGVGLGAGIVLFGSFVFAVGAVSVALWFKLPALAMAAGGVWLLAVFGFTYLVNVANDIYRCALYVYASEGVIPEPYTAELLDAAWKVKRT